MVRKTIIVHSNFFVGRFDIRSLERGLADNKGVTEFRKKHDDSYRPDVDFVAVTDLSFQNLRSAVVGRSTNGLFLFIVVFQTRRQTEVSKFDLQLVIEKEVAELQT